MTALKSWIAGDQILAADINNNFTEVNARKIETLIAGEAITIGNAVCAGFYQSNGGVLYNNKQQNNGTVAAGGSITFAFTVGSNSNRNLVVFVGLSGSTPSTATVTYNGVAMTQKNTDTQGSSLRGYSFYLNAPSTGANNIVVTLTGGSGTQNYSIHTYSYYNCGTASDANATGKNASSTATAAITTVANGALIVSGAVSNSTGGTITTAQFTNNTQTNGTNLDSKGGDSGQVFPAQAVNVTASSGAEIIVFSISLAPITTPSPAVLKASSATVTVGQNRYSTFIGFALTTGVAGAVMDVQVGGVVSQSGLTAAKQYYLADSQGAVGATVGTNTRKCGISLNTTQLLITNVW